MLSRSLNDQVKAVCSTGPAGNTGQMLTMYGVMQSDGNIFQGDVVSDSFHKASPDEDNILEQIYRSKYVRIVIMKILNFKSDEEKFLLKGIQHITTKLNWV